VPEDHICRVIYAFTEQLDMASLGYKYIERKPIGCCSYDPRMMLNLYIYGYLQWVYSSRCLRDEMLRNIEVMWPMEGLEPDDKTICNFRKESTKSLRETFRIFVMMCWKLGLYGEGLIAINSARSSLKNCTLA